MSWTGPSYFLVPVLVITKLGDPPVTFSASPSGGMVSTTKLVGVVLTAPPVKAVNVPPTRMPTSRVVGRVPVNISPLLPCVAANSGTSLADLMPVVVMVVIVLSVYGKSYSSSRLSARIVFSKSVSALSYPMRRAIEPLRVAPPTSLTKMLIASKSSVPRVPTIGEIPET